MSPNTSPSTRKAVYVCPTCGHESPVDGDWLVAEREVHGVPRLVYACPVCGRPVTTRAHLGPTGAGYAVGPSDTALGSVRGPLAAAARGLDDLAAAIRCGGLAR